MLHTWVTEDMIVIATGVHSFFVANHSFDDSYVGKQEESKKEKVYSSGQRIFLEKHQ